MRNDREGTSAKAPYLITIRGMLDHTWSDWFGGAEMETQQGMDGSQVTLLTGTLDHSALHGVLDRLRDLNVTLISVTRLDPVEGQGGR